MIRFGKLTMDVFLSSGTFRLSGVFNVTGRGLVLMGNLLDGEINSGDFLIFPSELGDRWVKIHSVEYVDHLQTLSTELALMVRLESRSSTECVGTLSGQDLTVTKGLDF